MTDIDPTVPPANNDTDPGNPGGGDDGKDWRAEAEKWKSLSRKHEEAEKSLKTKLAELETASMSDAEKAIQEARQAGASETLKKVSDRLVKAELKAVAASKGVTLPDVDALNLAKFTTEDGDPDEGAIEKFVESLGGSQTRFPDGKDLGIGRTGGTGVRQYSRDDIKGMTHEERVKAREAGHLDKLLGIGEFS